MSATARRPVPSEITASDAPISPGSSPRESSSPEPRRPLAPEPQHLMLPALDSAHVCTSPAAIARVVTPLGQPRSTVANASPISPAASPRAAVSPRPSWPSPLSPQHLTLALSSTAQVCAPPVANDSAVRPAPRSTGSSASPIDALERPRSSSAPLPNRPLAPSPKHFTDASSSSAQVCNAPADTARTVRPVPRRTATSASPISAAESPRATIPPEPICPTEFEPKHLSVPSSSTTQVCCSPVASQRVSAEI